MSVQIRPASARDCAAHFRLLAYFKNPNCGSSLWKWKYADGRQTGLRKTRIFLACIGKKVIGTISCAPTLLKLGDKVLVAYWAQDLVIHPDHRFRGIGTQLMQYVTDLRGIKMVLGAHSIVQRKIVQQLGWQQRKGVEFWGCDLRRWKAKVKESSQLERVLQVEEVQKFPQEVGTFSRRVSKEYDVSILKDKSYLDWRYCEAPFLRNPYLKFIVRKKGRMCGLFVLRLSHRKGGRAAIKEFWVGGGDPTVARFLLGEIRRVFSRLGVSGVKILLDDQTENLRQAFSVEGFVPLFDAPFFGFFLSSSGSEKKSEPFLSRGKLYLSSGDSDLGLAED